MAQKTAVEIENADSTIPLSESDLTSGILSKSWSVPPVCHDIVDDTTVTPFSRVEGDQSVILTQGIVYEINIKNNRKTLIQNISENEDDILEFSKHGDPCGVWSKLLPGAMIRTKTNIFLLNRTHKQNMAVSVI